MSLMREFKDFINKGNVIDLAVALVMGAAFNKIVDSLVKGVIMPVAFAFLPKGGWETWSIWRIKIGAVLDASFQFVLIAFVIFIVLKKFFNYKQKEAVVAPTPEDILLLRQIRDALRSGGAYGGGGAGGLGGGGAGVGGGSGGGGGRPPV
jgi:large conductance mechanosensitive channel